MNLRVKESKVVANEPCNDEMVVSFIALPTHIEDKQIIAKLTEWRVKPILAIRRRMWPGTDIAEGTHFLKVKFNNNVRSLCFATKF